MPSTPRGRSPQLPDPLASLSPGTAGAPMRVAVACSGGRDSTALLHATLRAAAPLGVQVVALHVHHGLMPQADAWAAQLQTRCARWARAGAPLSLRCQRLTLQPAPGDSVEAWARDQRYAALRQMARSEACGCVLLAHHRLDQAETFLLQALRGAGVAGLAAMPRSAERGGLVWLRPWLDQPRSAIDAYLKRHRLGFVDDPSNADPRYARNRLRQQVWPVLGEAFPQAEQVLADAARWAQQAAEGLRELAALDLPQVSEGASLLLPAWAALSPVRRGNVLRCWLHAQSGHPAPASLVERLGRELLPNETGGPGGPSGPAAARHWPIDDRQLRAWRGRLSLVPEPLPAPLALGGAQALRIEPLSIRRAGRYLLPAWGGLLQVRRVAQAGVPLAWLAQAELRGRRGGESFQAAPDRPPRSLKKQFQAAGVPAWQRGGPLVYSGGQLVFVPGLGLDVRVVGLPGQPLVTLAWLPTDVRA